MSYYNLRKNFFINFERGNYEIKAKLVIKTREIEWVKTLSHVVIPISIHSFFHLGIEGEMKMQAFISTIKQNVQSKVTILMTEMAHVNVLSLKDENAAETCKKDALGIVKRFQELFDDCTIVYWEEYIQKDPNYQTCKEKILEQYQRDVTFQSLLLENAHSTYTSTRSIEHQDKSLFLERAIYDLLEQSICLHVLSKKGYRFQFYPGRQYSAIEYLNQNISMVLVHVFVSIEKKRIYHKCVR